MRRNTKMVLSWLFATFLLGVIAALFDWSTEVCFAYWYPAGDILLSLYFVSLYWDEIKGGFQKCRPLKMLGISAAVYLVDASVSYLIMTLLSMETSENQQLIELGFSTSLLLPSISVIIAAPVIEEILFRFFLQSWLKGKIKKHGRVIAVIVSSLFFACIHLSSSPLELLPYFSTGIILGVLYEATGNISLTIFYHAFSNLIATILIVLGG